MVVNKGFVVGCSQALVDAWVRSAPGDPMTTDRFARLVLLDPNFDPDGLRLAWHRDQVIGAVYAVRRRVAASGDDLEPQRGWIPFMFTDPAHRRNGVATALLTEALDWLRDKGRDEVDFSSYTPGYILPGLDKKRYPEAFALLKRFGFTTLYRPSAMDMPLVDYEFPSSVRDKLSARRAEGYSFGTPSTDELVPLIALAGDHFNPDWARAIRDTVLSGVPTNRIIVARDPGGQIIGWGMCGAYDAVVDRFGPFGVLEELRGLGLGEILLHLCLERMKGLGAHSAWFLWTSETSPAGQLYLKTGFTTTRVFDVMRAPLAASEERS